MRGFVFALLLATLAGAAPSRSAATPTGGNANGALGTRAPEFTAQTVSGRHVSRHAYAGKVLVLNFWATWCPPCRAETPDLIAAFQRLKTKDVAFLGIDTTETAPIVRTFLSARSVPYDTALAGPGTYNGYGIAFIPTTIVVDPNGIVRARWTGGVTPQLLAQFVAGARKGQTVVYLSPAQRHIDALLDPNQFSFSASVAQVRAAAEAARRRVSEVDAYAATLPTAHGLAFDDERTLREEGTLLEKAASGLQAVASTRDDKILADRLLATAYADLNRFEDAAQILREALALEPHDPKLTYSLANAYYRLHDYPRMAQVARAYIALAPNDSDGYDQLGLAYQRSRRFADAVAPYERCVALLMVKAAGAPPKERGDDAAFVADESLDLANVYVSLGDRANARRAFLRATRYAAMIPANSQYADMRERAQDRAAEGMAAVALVHRTGTALALSKWTGPDLPGSLKSTYKYRLIVVAPAQKSVTLVANRVRPGWVASFCADGLCSPRTVSYLSPPSGVKTYEFQLVPPAEGAAPGRVEVAAGNTTAAVP
ncbi:MAG: redoxin domain-containing protein [Candidatus Eremiobacteraeota bacterium]|nr:redoxin domain-containing protein [Candidatus Eremiobacteraeota bacterium]